ncbi:putative PTS sugar transporter subunit IIA [Actinobacillus pleuropneumoniae]|nr:putative PTS sugar transporter subunit IIA [Actinobacillus pleuropneumoniae]KIE93303.1 putative PTS sugar transporter subunit IIA [Actinobacillus pleuropneumoniae]KIE99458.1 putative PTS sugar transporter subunit IIA [Actinobacillus pleuropneumoniae]KIE99653.1 putative PTS sugar transporter subunit IIA [Actinobacillus pleuropneumoniae]
MNNMKLTEFLTPENIRQGVLVSSKKRVLELAGKIIAEAANKSTACADDEGFAR